MLFRPKPKCPIGADAEQWVVGSFQWLIESLGYDELIDRAIMTPTPDFFPHPIELTEESAHDTLDRIAVHMGLDSSMIDLKFYSESAGEGMGPGMPLIEPERGTAGLYEDGERQTVWLEVSRCHQAVSMIATIAHELAHVVLIGGGHMLTIRDDDEPMTDLATVYLGLGLFNANAVISDVQWADGMWAGWSTGRLGYLDEQTFAYALAYMAKIRDEKRPVWARFLRPTVKSYFKQSARWIEANGD